MMTKKRKKEKRRRSLNCRGKDRENIAEARCKKKSRGDWVGGARVAGEMRRVKKKKTLERGSGAEREVLDDDPR